MLAADIGGLRTVRRAIDSLDRLLIRLTLLLQYPDNLLFRKT